MSYGSGPRTSFEWDISIPTMSVYDADGYLGIQVEGFGDGAGVDHGEVHTPYGLISRPLDPTVDAQGRIDPAKSGQALIVWDGPRMHVIPTQDCRVIPKLPRVKKGGSMLYGATGSFMLIDGETGSHTTYIPCRFTGDTPGGSASISVNVDTPGAEFISVVHPSGMCISMSGDQVTILGQGGACSLTVKPDGIQLLGANNVVYGGISLGSDIAQPVALAPATVTGFEAIAAAFAVINTTIPLMASGWSSLLPAQQTAFTTAMTTIAAALGVPVTAGVPAILTKAS